MAAEDCIKRIQDAAGRQLSDDELESIVSELQRRRDARRAEGALATAEEAMQEAGEEMADAIQAAAQIERRNQLLNIKVYQDLMAFAGRVDTAVGDPAIALQARMVGSNQRFAGARESAAARAHTLETKYMGGMIADLREARLLGVFNSHQLDREIANELAELSKKAGRPGVSGSDEATRIAKVIDKYRRVAVQRENRAGAWIKPLEGYVVRQSHDMHKIRRAGFDAWKAAIQPLLDPRTFGDANPDKFLRGAYDGIVTGRHILANGADEADTMFAFKGPANLAKRVSRHRVLHFRDADAWFDYNQSFGQASLSEAITHELERSARNTALMETFGPNPRAMFEKVRDALKDKHRGDVKKFNKLNAPKLNHQFAEIEGLTRIPANPTAAGVTSSVLAVEGMAKLGGAMLSSMADLAAKAHVLAQTTGDNILSAWGRNLTSSVKGMVPGEARRTAELIGVGIDGQIGDIAARFTAQDDLPGKLSKMQSMFFKLNLLGPWTDGNKRGLALMMAHDLGTMSNKGWAQINPKTRGLLELYGFTEEIWNVARKAARTEADGRVYLMPDAIQTLDDAALNVTGTPMPKSQAKRLRDTAETAVRNYYVDMAEEAVPTPGARERAILKQGTQPGTALGTALRLVGQFKAFPVTVLTKNIGRAAQADSVGQFFTNMVNGKADRLGLAHLIVGSTVLGYVSQSAKEMAKGRSPRDPALYETWVAAMLQGGGLGIYGDFFFGEYNRFGRSALDTLAGPTLGTGADLLELWAKVRSGDDAASSALRLAVGNTPFMNLFYTRAAMDYLVLYPMQEAINPGYLRRMESRIRRENNQTFMLPPSSVVSRGGGFGAQ
jgi:hypothetical protein